MSKLFSQPILLFCSVLLCIKHTFGLGGWPLVAPPVVGDGVNGGSDCATCTLLVAIVSETSQLYQESPEAAIARLCSYFPQDILHTACDAIHDTYGFLVSYYLNEGYSPDETCYFLGACTMDNGPLCRCFPGSDNINNDNDLINLKSQFDKENNIIYNNNLNNQEQQQPKNSQKKTKNTPSNNNHQKTKNKKKNNNKNTIKDEPNICNLPGVADICQILSDWGNDHIPVDDVDGDWFSDLPEMRGTMWRGKDCNDLDSNIYPGRIVDTREGDKYIDTNCNGIYGIDNITQRSYEDLYCDGTGQIGIVLFGDSAGAHFHIPPQWFNVTEMNENVFEQMYFVLLNELDWPMLSATTAIYNSTIKWDAIIDGNVSSLYEKFLKRNQCNHRDYQNLGVNGARSGAMASELIKTVKRNVDTDHPIFAVYELIGNDVCNGHPGMSHMTTPSEFYENNLKAFQYLDANVPYGSRVLAMGLANGSVLYDAMHDRIHPIGWLNQDVTYTNLYDYLNCLQISPCYGWMNSNATMRELTTQRAMELSAALKNLTETVTFENITVKYIDCPITDVIHYWHNNGGETWQLIEPVDGFHPNQQANSILADLIYQTIEQNISEWLPPINPHNDEIIEKFGDQGGY